MPHLTRYFQWIILTENYKMGFFFLFGVACRFSIVEVAHGPVLKSYTSCCVCGNLGEVEINRLLKCSSCFIRVRKNPVNNLYVIRYPSFIWY